MKKFAILILAVVITSALVWKIYDLKSSTKNYSAGIYDSEVNYVSSTNSSADRYIATLEEQLSEHNDNSNLLTKLGEAYIQKARESNDPEYYSLAEKVLDRAIENDPDNFMALAQLGSVCLSRHKFKEALECSEKALLRNPYSSYSLGVMVDAQVELGMYDEAIQSVQRMVNLRPDLSSYSRISYVRELKGDLAGAIDAMKSAITAGSPVAENTAWCRIQLGNLFMNSGNTGTAEMIFQIIIRDFPEYAHGYGGLARIKTNKGKYDEAINLYIEALEKNLLPEYMIALGDLYMVDGQKQKADEQYQKVKFLITMLKEKGVDTDLEIALFNADHKRVLKESLRDSEKLLDENNKSIKVYHAIAWIQFRLGNYEEAERNILSALSLGTREPLLFFHAGKIFEKRGKNEKAKDYLDYAMSIYPHFEKLYSVLD